jgi:hypothetical protein
VTVELLLFVKHDEAEAWARGCGADAVRMTAGRVVCGSREPRSVKCGWRAVARPSVASLSAATPRQAPQGGVTSAAGSIGKQVGRWT